MGEAEPVLVVVPEDLEDPPALSGLWPPSSGRLTQTQQSLFFAGFTHALQLEMSLSLRRTLARDKKAIDRLGSAILNPWLAITRQSTQRQQRACHSRAPGTPVQERHGVPENQTK